VPQAWLRKSLPYCSTTSFGTMEHTACSAIRVSVERTHQREAERTVIQRRKTTGAVLPPRIKDQAPLLAVFLSMMRLKLYFHVLRRELSSPCPREKHRCPGKKHRCAG